MSASRPPGCQGCLPRIVWYPSARPVWVCRCPPRKPYEPPVVGAAMHLHVRGMRAMSEESREAIFDLCAAAYRKLKGMQTTSLDQP